MGDDLTAGEFPDSAECLTSRGCLEDRHPFGEAAVSPMTFPELAGLKTAVFGSGLKDSGQCLLPANELEFAAAAFSHTHPPTSCGCNQYFLAAHD